MKQIGRRIYYDKNTGDVVLDTGERVGHVRETTINEDVDNYMVLSIINISEVGVTQLNYGQHAEEFAACTSYSVNPETGEIIFSYDETTQETE